MSKKQKTVPDFTFRHGEAESLIIYACRYCIGRSTYAPHEVMGIVEPLIPKLTSGTLACLDRDIESHGRMFGLGMDIDKEAWEEFRRKVVLELVRREQRGNTDSD